MSEWQPLYQGRGRNHKRHKWAINLWENSELLVTQSHLFDRDNKGSRPHALFGNPVMVDFSPLAIGLHYGFFEAGIDEIDLIGPPDKILLVLFRDGFSDQSFNRADELLGFNFLEMFLQ